MSRFSWSHSQTDTSAPCSYAPTLRRQKHRFKLWFTVLISRTEFALPMNMHLHSTKPSIKAQCHVASMKSFFKSWTDAASLRDHDSALFKWHLRPVSVDAILPSELPLQIAVNTQRWSTNLRPIVWYLWPVQPYNEGCFDDHALLDCSPNEDDPVFIYWSQNSLKNSSDL